MKNWNLDALYLGFDETYQNDLNRYESMIDDYVNWINSNIDNPKTYIEGYLTRSEELTKLGRTLGSFVSLTMSTDVTHKEAPLYMSKLQKISRKSTVEDVKFSRYLTTVDLDKLASDSKIISDYLYLLKLVQSDAKHLLSEKEEVLYAKLRELASSSWGQLQSITTANLPVIYRGKEITLSEVRNLAYDQDPEVRKDAYEAEIKSFGLIEDTVAMALSNIKREVVIMNELRGYESALDKTLESSKMTRETLEAMISAMKDFRPDFEKYLQGKAKYLGHKNNLPFYDMFAPVGKLEKTYTYEEAQDIIKKAYYGFSKRLGDFATKAFDQEWIDVYPEKR